MSHYQDTISLICHIYEQNGKYPPVSFKEMMTTKESREFASYAFSVVMETIELMDSEDYNMSSNYGFTNEDLEVTIKTLKAYNRYPKKEESYAINTMNEIDTVVMGLPESVEELEEFKKGE